MLTHYRQQRVSPRARRLDIDAPVIPFDDLPNPDDGRVINSALLLKIHDAAQAMVLPTWMTRLPRTFGVASSGSVKADQWRVLATLYAPLVLIREWHAARDGEDARVWLEATTDLMSAIYACTSHTVSKDSIDLYKQHILSYLNHLKSHFKCKWVPNYHASLHVIALLEDYGPAYGWWTFPFERLIRELQNVNNNSRLGMSANTLVYIWQYLILRAIRRARSDLG